jgi:hypothetical protein
MERVDARTVKNIHGEEEETAMGEPIRSRILDYVEDEPPALPATKPTDAADRAAATEPAGQPTSRPSRLLDYVDEAPPEGPAANRLPGPKPGVPAYHTPVFVPAHPRYAVAQNAEGRPVRVPLIAYELFEHPTDGTVAFAFSTLEKLVAALGEAQPWVASSIGPLAEGMRERGFTVHLDPRVAPGHHNWQPADLAAYAQEMR